MEITYLRKQEILNKLREEREKRKSQYPSYIQQQNEQAIV